MLRNLLCHFLSFQIEVRATVRKNERIEESANHTSYAFCLIRGWVDAFPMLHAQPAKLQKRQQAVAEHQFCHFVLQGIARCICMVAYERVEKFPVWFALKIAVVSESVQIRLVSRFCVAVWKQFLVLLECGFVLVRAVPVQRFVDFYNGFLSVEV